MPYRIHLFPFEYWDMPRRRWVRARYLARLEVIGQRHDAFRLVGPPEPRNVPDDPLYEGSTGRLIRS